MGMMKDNQIDAPGETELELRALQEVGTAQLCVSCRANQDEMGGLVWCVSSRPLGTWPNQPVSVQSY